MHAYRGVWINIYIIIEGDIQIIIKIIEVHEGSTIYNEMQLNTLNAQQWSFVHARA